MVSTPQGRMLMEIGRVPTNISCHYILYLTCWYNLVYALCLLAFECPLCRRFA
jgi:hypothetical protein